MERSYKKIKLNIKDRNLRKLLRKGGRVGAREDFFELLKRAVRNSRKY